jgi:hypothetical protein
MRSAKHRILGVLLLVSLLCLVALAFFRVWECTQCRGTAGRVQEQGVPWGTAQTGCPACADRGKVSFFTAQLRRKADALLCQMIQNPTSLEEGRDIFLGALTQLLQRNGSAAPAPNLNRGQARFAVVNEVPVVLAIMNQSSWSIPGTSGGSCWLFDFRGKLLDFAAASCSTRGESLYVVFEDGQPADGTAIRVHGDRGFVPLESFEGFDLEHKGRRWSLTPQDKGWPKDWLTQGLCRLGVTSDGFRMITPTLGADDK